MTDPPNTPAPEPPRWRAALFVGTLIVASLGLAAVIATFNFHVQVQPDLFPREQAQRDCRQIMVDALRDEPALCTANAVLLGSSRTKALADIHVGDNRFLNLACDDMAPVEFPAYVDYFVEACGREPQTIAVALDFYGSSTHRVSVPNPPSYYIDKAKNPTYQLGLYDALSVDQTRETLAFWQDPKTRKHFRWDQVKASLYPSEKQAKKREKRQRRQTKRRVRVRKLHDVCLEQRVYPAQTIGPAVFPEEFKHQGYYREAYGNYQLDPRNVRALHHLHASHPTSRFVVYITPVSHVLFSLLVDHGLVDELHTYLGLLVDEFGAVTTFLDPNSVTSMRANFRDENHLHRATADLLLARVLDDPSVDVPKDFGRTLTAENLEAYRDELKRWASAPRISASRRKKPPPPATMSYSQASARPRVEGSSWSDCTRHIRDGIGLKIALQGAPKGTQLEVSLDSGDRYELVFRHRQNDVSRTEVGPKKRVNGLAVYTIDLPGEVGTDVDEVWVRPLKGDNKYALGHLLIRDP